MPNDSNWSGHLDSGRLNATDEETDCAAVHGARPMVREIFETVALSDVIPVVEDQTKAIEIVSS